MPWQTPIIDRTQADVDYANANRNDDIQHKGAQGYMHWARMTGNMYYLADMLTKYHRSVILTCRNQWDKYTIPRESEIAQIRADLQIFVDTFYRKPGTPITPELNWTHYEKINDIEKILLDIYTLLLYMISAFISSGTTYSGMDGLRV